MLEPIKIAEPATEPVYGTDSPTMTCEACKAQAPRHLFFNAVIWLGSPGHPSLLPLQCPAIEHWACSIECWAQVAKACVDEHMKPYLQSLHESIRK